MEKRSPKFVMEKGSPKIVMEKLTPKSPVIYERYKSGCAWGLISFLDFRQGHSNKKLISDKHRRAAGNECASKRLKLLSEFDEKSINDGVDNKSLTVGSGKAEAKKTVEENMSTDQQIKKKITTAKVQHVQSDSDHVSQGPKNHRKASKTFWRPCYSNDVAIVGHRQPSHQNLVEKSSDKLKSTTTEEICNQVHHKSGRDYSGEGITSMKHDQLNEINLQLKMNEAAEAFINQKFIHGENLGRDGASHQSKNFLDALEILNSNKELFVKLLQDPNSLLVKHVQDLQDSQAQKQQTKSISQAQSSEHQTHNAREREEPVRTQKLKSCDRDSAKGSADTSTIVLLKPGPTNMQNSVDNSGQFPSLQLHHNLRSKGQSVKPAIFSFKHMKRKLSHAMGVSRKEQPCTSNDGKLLQSPYDFQGSEDVGKGTGRQIVGRNSTSETCLDVGGMASSSVDDKRRDKMIQAKDFESGIGHEAASICENGHKISKFSIVRHPKQSESDIYVESRKHLFEMLSHGNVEFLRKRIPKTRGRITSPEYDFLPILSSGRDKEHGSVIAQTRFSPYRNYQMVNENKCRRQKEEKNGILHQQRQDVEASPWADMKKPDDQLQTYDREVNVSEDLFPDTKAHENFCFFGDDSSHRVYQTSAEYVKIVETNGTVHPGETNSLKAPFEPDGTHNTGANQSTDTACMCEENGFLECSKLDSPLENDASVPSVDVCSSSPSSIQSVEDSDSLKDKPEQQSPLSVLEQFFTEDVVSPASTISEHAEPLVQPIQVNVEEHQSDGLVRCPLDLKINLSTSFDEHESTSEYVRAVLQASGFNWDELSMKCYSSAHLLNPSVCDEVEVWPNQSHSDCRLLFDHINEVFLEVYQCYFRCSPWVSLIDPKIRPVPVVKDVINEVMKCVDWDLISQMSSQTVEQLVEKDLAKAGTWLDIRIDMEDIVIMTVEGVLEELIMETSMELKSEVSYVAFI